jgi:ABC-2 type transport system ATP-binding protein
MTINKRSFSKQPPQPETYIVQALDVTSSEMYRYPDGFEEAVLRNITMDIKRGESWGIIGEEAFELELMMQIIANVRPYGSGRCSLVERGMMRRKRRILSHVFYISGGDTVPGNLNTLEYLMYITARSHVSDRQRQATILEALLASGLYYLTLVPMKYLNAAERATICLLSAAMSRALLVVFSVADITFQPQLTQSIGNIVKLIAHRGGAVLMGTTDCDLAQDACTHAAFLINGKFAESGRVETLLEALDKRAFILTSSEPKALAKAITSAADGLETYVFDKEVHVYVRGDGPITQAAMLYILMNAGQTVETLQTSKRTLRNAYREVLAGHAI